MADESKIENQLFSSLLRQDFSDTATDQHVLDECKKLANAVVEIEGNIAVLSDFQTDTSYIYAGSFGKVFELPNGYSAIDSAFEHTIFSKIHRDDLIERHVLELNYFQLQKMTAPEARRNYSTHCRLRIQNVSGTSVYVTHRTLYLRSLPDGNVWLALCLYSPATSSTPTPGIDGKIVNHETGEVIQIDRYKDFGKHILSRREIEIVNHLAGGLDSGEIAKLLHISVYTVRRHRQNILHKLDVANTSEAIRTCSLMGLLNG